MEKVRQIFQSLSKTELRYLKSYLSTFHSKGGNKALEFIKTLERRPNISQDKISERLYGDPKSKAFIMLKARVFERMLETLSLNINIRNNPIFKEDPIVASSVEIVKEITSALILRGRGLKNVAKEILKKCLKKSLDLGFPEYQIQILIYLKNMATSEKELNEYETIIQKAWGEYETDIRGVHIFDEFRVLMAGRTSKDSKTIAFLEKKTTELEGLLHQCHSARAYYYFLSLKCKLCEIQNDYSASKEYIYKMLEMFDENIGLKSRNRLGVPYIRLASLELSHGYFESSRQAAIKAMEVMSDSTQNFFVGLMYRFLSCLYLGNLEEAKGLLPLVKEMGTLPPENYLSGISCYMQSCLEYMRGNYHLALLKLQQTARLFENKDGWNLGLRIYEIFILIDLDELDVATAKIETLRKHIARYDPDQRTVLIYKYLYLLEKRAFKFEEMSENQYEILHQLETQDPWNPLSHEVIKFEVWLEAKQANFPFGPLLKQRINHFVLVN